MRIQEKINNYLENYINEEHLYDRVARDAASVLRNQGTDKAEQLGKELFKGIIGAVRFEIKGDIKNLDKVMEKFILGAEKGCSAAEKEYLK